MKIILLSSPDKFNSEILPVIKMFESGLQYFHLRKPEFSRKKIKEYLKGIPEKHHNKIILHSHHGLSLEFNLKGIHFTKIHKKTPIITWIKRRWLTFRRPGLCITTSFHSLKSIEKNAKKYSYVFLSPIFDSISKKGYRGGFDHDKLKETLLNTDGKVIALGGVDEDNILLIRDLGFEGAALLGAVWNSGKDEVSVLKNALRQAESAFIPEKVS